MKVYKYIKQYLLGGQVGLQNKQRRTYSVSQMDIPTTRNQSDQFGGSPNSPGSPKYYKLARCPRYENIPASVGFGKHKSFKGSKSSKSSKNSAE